MQRSILTAQDSRGSDEMEGATELGGCKEEHNQESRALDPAQAGWERLLWGDATAAQEEREVARRWPREGIQCYRAVG